MLAIIIPFYNIIFFEETLISLANQTNKKFNVYIGNDGSESDPSEVINKYSKDLNINYIKFENNLGHKSLVSHWERCVKMINQEKWIMILGDDDWLSKDLVENWYNKQPQFNNKYNLIRFSSISVNNITNQKSKLYKHPILENAISSYYKRFLGDSRSTLSEYIFSKKVFDKYGFFNYPLAWHSDDRMWIEYSENKPIFTINDATVYVRISNQSISGKQNNINKKKIASLAFYKFLISQDLNHLKKKEKLSLFLYFEEIKKTTTKVDNKDYYFLFPLYLKNFSLFSFLKFLRRFLINNL